jgi:hypothetical protein
MRIPIKYIETYRPSKMCGYRGKDGHHFNSGEHGLKMWLTEVGIIAEMPGQDPELVYLEGSRKIVLFGEKPEPAVAEKREAAVSVPNSSSDPVQGPVVINRKGRKRAEQAGQ